MLAELFFKVLGDDDRTDVVVVIKFMGEDNLPVEVEDGVLDAEICRQIEALANFFGVPAQRVAQITKSEYEASESVLEGVE